LQYRVSAAWNVSQSDAVLVLHGGADAEYEVPLDSSEPSIFTKKHDSFTVSSLHDSDKKVLDQLVLAGVVEIVNRKKGRKLKVVCIGDVLPFEFTHDRIELVASQAVADVVLVGRHTSWHGEVIKKTDYYAITQPHLYVDAAYHHTLSIGPLVYPGQTACVGCLYGRLRERWGDEQPPVDPGSVMYKSMMQAWVERELERIADGDTSLVGKTIAWDMDGRTMQQDILLKSSACPRCGMASNDGRILLR
jgi:hypothetical protein